MHLPCIRGHSCTRSTHQQSSASPGHSLPAFLWISAASLGTHLFIVPSDPLSFLQKTLVCCIIWCLCLIRYLVCLWNFPIKTRFLPLNFLILGLCLHIRDCINCREGPQLAFCCLLPKIRALQLGWPWRILFFPKSRIFRDLSLVLIKHLKYLETFFQYEIPNVVMIIIRKRLCKPVMGQGTTTQCLLHCKQSVLLNMSLSSWPYWLLVLTHLHSLYICIYI